MSTPNPIVKANFRQVKNINPITEQEEIQLQGTAILKSLGTNWLETNSEDPKKYKIGQIILNVDGNTPEIKSAQIFEATLNGNKEKGTVPVAVDDVVAINVSADDNNTYFRVIGSGSGGLETKDLFASLMEGSKPMVTALVDADAPDVNA